MSQNRDGDQSMNPSTRILHLEANAADSERVQEMLESAGLHCEIVRVQTRDEFSHALQQGKYDLIFADFSLATYDGLSALRLIQELGLVVPFIFVSGQLGADAAIEGLTQGAAGYVLKQNLGRLAPAVQRALQEAENRRERQRANQASLETQERFRALTEHTSDLIAIIDRQKVIRFVSPSVKRILGYAPEKLVGQNLLQWIHPDDLAETENALAARFEHAETPADALETRVRHQDGAWRVLEMFSHDMSEHPAIQGMVLNARDITRRKQAETELKKSQHQLRELATHLTSVRESERAFIAREIHDELGQLLTGLKFDLFWLKSNLAKRSHKLTSRQAVAKIADMIKLVASTISSARRIAAELRPAGLDELGLVAAIEWQVKEFTRHSNVPCALTDTVQALDISSEQSTALLRILQEALTNVARHANATQVHVVLQMDGEELRLAIQDNGKGMTKDQWSNVRSFGIASMHERALVLGGQIQITSAPKEGTTVAVHVPLKKLLARL